MKKQQFILKKGSIPDALSNLHAKRPYFNHADVVGRPMFIAWIDIMGTASPMARSMATATIIIGKLHTAILRAIEDDASRSVAVHPLVDGAYLSSDNRDDLLSVVTDVMRGLAITFIMTDDALHHFMVRCCVSFGPVVLGESLRQADNAHLAGREGYTGSILLGPAVAGAYLGERNASPFGVWIDAPARLHPEVGQQIPYTHFPWWLFDKKHSKSDLLIKNTLSSHLGIFLQWCEDHSTWILYPKEDIKRHRAMVNEYFSNAGSHGTAHRKS